MSKKKQVEKIVPKVNFCHLCDYASFAENGKINIMGIFQNIASTKLPVVHPQMFVVLSTTFGTENVKKESVVLKRKEDGFIMLTQEFPLEEKIQDEKRKVASLVLIGQLNMLSFDKDGDYVFEIYLDDEKIGEAPLEILIAA